jgi:hypothetical protein
MSCGMIARPIADFMEPNIIDAPSPRYPFVCQRRSQERLRKEAVRFYEAISEDLPVEEPRLVEESADEGDSSSDDEESAAPAKIADDSLRRTSWFLAPNNCLTLELLIPESAPCTPRIVTTKRYQHQSFPYLLPLPDHATVHGDFAYRGISCNPPEITQRGIARGNVAQIHRKAWLEVSDPKHRYGKNLRLYYRHWESLGYPTDDFFDWLDSDGEAGGYPLPNIPECPRSDLDSDTVLYISDPEVTNRFALQLECDDYGHCRILDRLQRTPISTGPKGWIFVLRDGVVYGAQKVNSAATGPRFHHSSFFGGKAVAAAGILITDEQGYLNSLYPHSGHYRPGEADMQRILYFLHKLGIDLQTFQVDTQQLIRVSRQEGENNHQHSNKKRVGQKDHKKSKKTDSLHLKPAADVAHYLSHKARFIGGGLLAQIQSLEGNVNSFGQL